MASMAPLLWVSEAPSLPGGRPGGKINGIAEELNAPRIGNHPLCLLPHARRVVNMAIYLIYLCTVDIYECQPPHVHSSVEWTRDEYLIRLPGRCLRYWPEKTVVEGGGRSSGTPMVRLIQVTKIALLVFHFSEARTN